MVNLPSPQEQPVRNARQAGSVRFTRNHHNWGARYGRHRDAMRDKEPTTVYELDSLAVHTEELMEKYTPKSNKNYAIAMDLLRLQYNLNFMIACEHCNGNHGIDELIAPER
ncbi:uncharacterized protein LOC114239300 [Bombyx mandarina]|uniref:Uncharacterized protein n=2 Tax=Bombyx TaxID=7090 RepID=A0A8R2DNC4_BOMMO|nr:uncharacterized protein LOC101741925 [Bombyx mori]XP_028025250.1 uncharacterized protein LOC114239300 [Bombyx mandarina]